MVKRLSPGSVDVVVTSPPYNLGINYSKYDDTISRGEYLAWLGKWAEAVKTVLSDNGSVFLNIGGKPTDPWVPFQVITEMGKHFELQNVIHWIKSIAIEKESVGDYPGITQNVSVGHYKPINGPRFINDCHEYVFHLTKSGSVPLDRTAIGVEYQDKSNVTRWKSAGSDKRCRGNTNGDLKQKVYI
jgi:site-specific DNA-methyltransferase (adenine-specific)